MYGSPRVASLGLTQATNQVSDQEWHTSAVSYHQVPVPLIENQQHKKKNCSKYILLQTIYSMTVTWSHFSYSSRNTLYTYITFIYSCIFT